MGSKVASWKRLIHNGLLSARKTLQKWYEKTYDFHGTIYAIATMLNPSIKMNLFSLEAWNDADWASHYRQQFGKVYDCYMERCPSLAQPDRSMGINMDDALDRIRSSQKRRRLNDGSQSTDPPNPRRELDEYLDSRKLLYHGIFYLLTVNSACVPERIGKNILGFWATHEPQYPVLAKVARDFLAIPVSGVGVESLFSISRDVCHYRRSRLSGNTIEAVIKLLMADRGAIAKEFEELKQEEEDDDDEQAQASDYLGLDISDDEGLDGTLDDTDDDESLGDGNEGDQQKDGQNDLEPGEDMSEEHSNDSDEDTIPARRHRYKGKGKEPSRKSRRAIPESGYYHRLQNSK